MVVDDLRTHTDRATCTQRVLIKIYPGADNNRSPITVPLYLSST